MGFFDKLKPGSSEESFEDAFYADVDKKYSSKQADYNSLPQLQSSSVRENVQNILELMNIPESYEIKQDVLMPEDFDDVEFGISIPQGYDLTDVDNFKARALASIEFYISLLKERNAHVAWLATAIDKLQVDMNNIRYDQESAHGVNIALTGDPTLEKDLTEAKLRIKQLEDELSNATDLAGADKRVKALQDKLALQIAKNQKLREEIQKLQAELDMRMKEAAPAPLPAELPEIDLPVEEPMLPDLMEPSLPDLVEDDEPEDFPSIEDWAVDEGVDAPPRPKSSLFGGEKIVDPFNYA